MSLDIEFLKNVLVSLVLKLNKVLRDLKDIFDFLQNASWMHENLSGTYMIENTRALKRCWLSKENIVFSLTGGIYIFQ